MNQFYTPPLLITEYYDSLISELDIYTEETIKEYKEKGLTVKKRPSNVCKKRANLRNGKTAQTYGVETLNNPYKSQKYSINRNDISDTKITNIKQAEEYMNKVRQKAIEEIRKVKDENLEYYKENKEKFKVDKKNLTEEKLEELKSQLFANKFCFLVKKQPDYILGKSDKNRYNPLFNLHTVITNFYLRESDIDYIRRKLDAEYKINHPSTKLDKRFLVANQLHKYIKETLNEDLNGYEIIHIKQKTLFEIEHIEVSYSYYNSYYNLSFDETNLSSFDIDLSTIKSLSIEPKNSIISDLKAFANLEYLSIAGFKLCQSTFQYLHKLIKLRIYKCDLSEFDFDSLNSMTSLQILIINIDISASLKIDLTSLINLKWIFLGFVKENVENNLELITDDSYNQLAYVSVKNATMDFSKQLDLPALKCLHISSVNLSKQISNQCFNCINLIELNLDSTQLENVDFLGTDRFGNLEKLELINRTDKSEAEVRDISQEEDYLNKMRQKAIDEIRKVQDENLEYYKANKEKFKVESLTLNVKKAKINDLSAFVNLEYLSISGFKFCQSTFQNLHKLINLRIYKCNLSEFDFDSLNSLTSLQIIDISTNISVAFKIDLSRLINLKWLELDFIKKQSENNLDLITTSYNQLTKISVFNKTIDFSKQLDLPALKCLEISNVDLSQQIGKQSFNSMTSLIKLLLNNTYLTNVDFLDTDLLVNLEVLDLSQNQIRVLKKGAFSKLKKLKFLYLNCNYIRELIPGVFDGLELSLEDLNISENGIYFESIDKKVFDGLTGLKNLYITDYGRANIDHLKRDGLNVY